VQQKGLFAYLMEAMGSLLSSNGACFGETNNKYLLKPELRLHEAHTNRCVIRAICNKTTPSHDSCVIEAMNSLVSMGDTHFRVTSQISCD
jgi:hypothetical protein